MRKLPIILFLFVPVIAQASPTIDASFNTDILLIVGCALMFGFGFLGGK